MLVNEHIYSAILLSSTALDDVGGHLLRIAHANGKDLELMRKVSIPAELKVPGAFSLDRAARSTLSLPFVRSINFSSLTFLADETLLFRQDSPHTTALKEYIVLCGGSYLRKILRSAFRTLMKRSAGVQYEVSYTLLQRDVL